MDTTRERLDALLRLAVERGAHDIHLKVPSPPLIRARGRLQRLDEIDRITPSQAEEFLAAMLATLPHAAKQVEFDARGEVDFSFAYPGLGRFRVNAYRQRGSVSLVLRPVPFEIPRLADLGLPPEVEALSREEDGLIIVSGPVGSGVTTTIAALLDRMNDGTPRTIITIEDPIEVLHSDRTCAISQREVGLDTASMADGLARVLRHDPDVIMVGDLEHPDALETVLAAALNGILVVGALTAPDPGECVERLVALTPFGAQIATRAALAAALRGVVTQRLVPREDGGGRRAEARVVTGSDRLRHLVLRRDAREPDTLAGVAPGLTGQAEANHQ